MVVKFEYWIVKDKTKPYKHTSLKCKSLREAVRKFRNAVEDRKYNFIELSCNAVFENKTSVLLTSVAVKIKRDHDDITFTYIREIKKTRWGSGYPVYAHTKMYSLEEAIKEFEREVESYKEGRKRRKRRK